MEDQKKNVRQPVWGPRIFLFGALLFVAYLILVYGFKITAGTLYTLSLIHISEPTRPY